MTSLIGGIKGEKIREQTVSVHNKLLAVDYRHENTRLGEESEVEG